MADLLVCMGLLAGLLALIWKIVVEWRSDRYNDGLAWRRQYFDSLRDVRSRALGDYGWRHYDRTRS